MNQSSVLLKEIHESFKDAALRQPAYREILSFFENLYELQEAAVPVTFPKGLNQNSTSPRHQNDARTPLIDPKQVSIDITSAMRVLRVICSAAGTSSPKLADAAALLESRLQTDDTQIQHGLDSLMAGDDEALEVLSENLGIDKTIFAFFLYHSIWPSLARYVNHFKENEAISTEWEHPTCPVCGSSPNLAFLSETGKRFLVCGFCRWEWAAKRILCPHCSNDEADTLKYFYSEEEKAYRVYTCDKCNQYIKTVDLRELQRRFYPPLESLITLHLDMQAESLGYQRSEGSRLFGG